MKTNIDRLIQGEYHTLSRAPHDYIFRTVNGEFIFYDLDTDECSVMSADKLRELSADDTSFTPAWDEQPPSGVSTDFDSALTEGLSQHKLAKIGKLYALVNGSFVLVEHETGYGEFFDTLADVLNYITEGE